MTDAPPAWLTVTAVALILAAIIVAALAMLAETVRETADEPYADDCPDEVPAPFDWAVMPEWWTPDRTVHVGPASST